MRQLGIAAYLRNLSVRTNEVLKSCKDSETEAKLTAICAELTDKAEAIEKIFRVQALSQ